VERITRAAAALGISIPRLSGRRVRYILTLVLAAALMPAGSAVAVNSLTSASVALSDPQPGATSDYTFTASSVTSAQVQCVKAVFSTTAAGDTAPTGWSGASGTVTGASSTLLNSPSSGWTLAKSDGTSSSGQNNIWQYTNGSGVTPSTLTGATFVMSGITNSTTPDTGYYLSISTFNNTNCSSNPVDAATVMFIDTTGQTLSLSVGSTLTFSVNGVGLSQSCGGSTTTHATTSTTIPFGTVSSGSNAVACQDLTASINSGNGFTVYARYTGQPSNGTHPISDLTPGVNSSPSAFSGSGTEAYGYTTDDQTLSTCGGSCSANRFYNGTTFKWAAMSTSNEEIAYETAGVANQTYRIGHQVGISNTTPAGTYSTTVIYTCTPIY
jgi:hypothetical protein